MKNPVQRRVAHLLTTSVFAAVLATSATPGHGQPVAEVTAELGRFFAGATLVSEPTIVDCTLSRGTRTQCFSVTVKPDPQSDTPGPWCPNTISDGPEAGGIWIHDGETVDVDGAFIARLAEIYGDSRWRLFDPATGKVRFTGTLEACEAAARPDVDPAYNNYCVQCLPEYMPEDATITFVIPLKPEPTFWSNPTRFGGAGVAYNGVRLDGPAPLDAILDAHTIAPFDDCGGHVNLHVGYHYHAVTDCLDEPPASFGPVTGTDAAALGGQIGIAMDGYQIFPHRLASGAEPDDLDRCNGHEGEGLAYHYHAGAAGSNAILGCLKAEAGCVLESPGAVCDASAPPKRP